jgi:hypothetical protein
MGRSFATTKRKRILEIAISSLWAVMPAFTAPDERPEVSLDGWTVVANPSAGLLTVTHEGLGTLMKNVRLQLRSASGLRLAKDWQVVRQLRQLSIQTAEPRTTWLLEPGPSTLTISSTSASAVLTAELPAASDRVVVRALDTQGTPVTWVGTDEVKNGYGGTETRNPSFLPTLNPEVMYFRLGQVAGSLFHALFDVKTDTVIEFTPQTRMERQLKNQDLLDITMPVPGNAIVRLRPDYLTKSLGLPYYVPFDDSHFTTAPAIWGSWTSYYGEVTEADIVRNTDWVAAHLLPYGFHYIELDDGYDGRNNINGSVGENHNWIGEWDRVKFPHGPKWLTDYIKSKGLHAGLWLVPNAYAAGVEQHPDWYLRDKEGKIIRDYNTAALDSTNPEVQEFLKKLFTTLDRWGFEYYKFDGEHALPRYIPAVDKSRLFEKSTDLLEAYRARLKLIRDVVGPRTFIEGCPAGTPLNGIGYFNSYFTGQDVYNSWQGMYPLFSSINGNAFLNHMVVYVMPGEGIELTPPMTVDEARQKRPASVVQTAQRREDPLMGFGTTMPEARTLVTYLSLTGVAYPVASVMAELPDERVRLLTMTLPTMPIFPIDLFSRGTDAKWDTFKHTRPDDYIHNYPEILDLKVNAPSGAYDVVGLTNWRSQKELREISFADKLGLDRNARHIVFDFWDQKLLGMFDDPITVDVEPHDTRVLLIHPVLNRPQLVGTSRHITGAYSIRSLEWDASQNRLHGSSQSIPGESYILRVYVPKGMTTSKARAATANGAAVPVRHELNGNLLSVGFEGRKEPVEWEIRFAAIQQ